MQSPSSLWNHCEQKSKKAVLTLHNFFCENGLDTHPASSARLVSIFARSGFLHRAQLAFQKLPLHDTASWSSLIVGMLDHGHPHDALSLYRSRIHGNQGVSLGNRALSALLEASCMLKDVDLCLLIHDSFSLKGLFAELDVYVSSALISLYAKSGLMAMAEDVSSRIAARNVVTWNALMAGYVDCGHGEEAICCFEKMQEEDVFPSEVSLVLVLRACALVQDLAKGYKSHRKIVERGLIDTNACIGSSLVGMYSSLGLLKTAREVFEKLPVRDVVSWNTLISALVEHGAGDDALRYLYRMRINGISPTSVTYVSVLKACSLINSTVKAQNLHSEIVKSGLDSKNFIVRALLVMYSRHGALSEAETVFSDLKIRDVVSWTAFISGCLEIGCNEKALSSFERMQEEGIVLDCIAFVCAMKACGSIGASLKGRRIHAEITKKGLENENNVGNTLINMYGEFGLLATAQQVFDRLLVRDLVSWNALISAYARFGESERVFQIFDMMVVHAGLHPDIVAILSVLNACNHSGLVESAQMFFETLTNELCCRPSADHYACLIDLLGRAGLVEKAIVILENVPSHPNSSFWHTILGACQKWRNADIGRHAFDHAKQMGEHDATTYVYMWNVYSIR